MRCPEEGLWQAWLDDELDGTAREGLAAHLAACETCSRTVAELTQLARQQDTLLEHVRLELQRTDGVVPDLEDRWRALSQRLAVASAPAVPGEVASPGGAGAAGVSAPGIAAGSTDGAGVDVLPSVPARRRRRWLALGAAAAVALSLAVVSVRDATASLFRIFRVQRVALVPFTPEMEAEISAALQRAGGGRFDLREFGELEVEAAPPQQLPPAEAARRGGFPALPARLDGAELLDTYLRPRIELRMALDTAAINGLLARLGSRERLPGTLDGRPIRVVVPAELTAHYGVREAGGPRDSIQVTLLRAPEIAVPEGVEGADLERARRALLSLPFLPPDLRRHLEVAGDWRTVLVPMHAEMRPERVDLGGVEAWTISSHAGPAAVLWLEDGVITMVNTDGDRDRIVALARALREGWRR